MGADEMTLPELGALPPWKIAAALLLATLLIGVIGWRVTLAVSGPPRPDLPVHAGMYDLRTELQKGAAPKKGTS